MSTTDRPTITADALPDEPLGQTLGRYKLLEKIGEGGFGIVYVAGQREPSNAESRHEDAFKPA